MKTDGFELTWHLVRFAGIEEKVMINKKRKKGYKIPQEHYKAFVKRAGKMRSILEKRGAKAL